MVKRIISGIILVVLALFVFWFGGWVLFATASVFALIAAFEYLKGLRGAGMRPLYALCYAFYPLIVFAFLNDRLFSFMIAGKDFFTIYITFIVGAALAVMVFFHKKFDLKDVAASFFGGVWIFLFFSFFLLLRGRGEGLTGFFYVVLAMFITAMSDAFALFAGKLFGKRKLIPEVSPNKTVAGSVGAVAGGTVSSMILGIIFMTTGVLPAFSWYHYLVLGLVIGIISQIGDLSASAVKRFCGLKDFGKIIPGHGGILDRMDSHMYVLPFMYFFVMIVTGAF